MIALEDLKGKTDAEIRQHIIDSYEYSGDASQFDILIAYESVGSWGCDSSSFFLIKDKATGELLTVNGSHCSCYGFEGQFTPEKTTIQALKYLATEGRVFCAGGYDKNENSNTTQIIEYITNL